MNCKTWSWGVSAAVLCLFAACAGAAEPGFYVAASLGMSEEDPESAGIAIGIGNSVGISRVEPDTVDVDDGDLSWSIGLGYRINKYLAAEVEYVDFGNTDVTEHYSLDNPAAPFPSPAVFDLEYSSHVTGPVLSLLGTLPVGKNFELYLRGGALFASQEYELDLGGFEESFSSTVWLAGAGITWSFAKRWAIRAEYQQTGKLSESFISGETRLQKLSLSTLFKL